MPSNFAILHTVELWRIRQRTSKNYDVVHVVSDSVSIFRTSWGLKKLVRCIRWYVMNGVRIFTTGISSAYDCMFRRFRLLNNNHKLFTLAPGKKNSWVLLVIYLLWNSRNRCDRPVLNNRNGITIDDTNRGAEGTSPKFWEERAPVMKRAREEKTLRYIREDTNKLELNDVYGCTFDRAGLHLI